MPFPIILLLEGIAIGMVIAVPAGPVGVLCVRRTLFEGALFGIVSAFGAALADMVFGLIAGFGLTVVRDWLLGFQDALACLGGLYLLFAGLHALVRGPTIEAQPLTGEKLAAAFASTFALSITNPVTILAFAAIFAKVGFRNGGLDWVGVCVLVGGVLADSLLWWLGLTLGITAVKRSARTMHFSWINRISGTVLTLSGLALLASVAIAWIGHPT